MISELDQDYGCMGVMTKAPTPCNLVVKLFRNLSKVILWDLNIEQMYRQNRGVTIDFDLLVGLID